MILQKMVERNIRKTYINTLHRKERNRYKTLAFSPTEQSIVFQTRWLLNGFMVEQFGLEFLIHLPIRCWHVMVSLSIDYFYSSLHTKKRQIRKNTKLSQTNKQTKI